MAADTEQVIIDIEVNYSEAIANLAKYRAEAGKLRQANAELKKKGRPAISHKMSIILKLPIIQ